MKKMLSILGVLSLSIMINIACRNLKDEYSGQKTEQALGTDEKEDNKPTDIPFTEYSLSGSSCEWMNPGYPYPQNGELIIINSDEELTNCITCTGKDSHPAIDFSKYTLLLARGVEPYLTSPGHKSLQQLSSLRYVMNVNLRPNMAAVITSWQVAITISKLEEGSCVELNVTEKIE